MHPLGVMMTCRQIYEGWFNFLTEFFNMENYCQYKCGVPVRLMSQMIKSSFSRRKFFGEKVVINGWAVPLELINWMDFLVMYFLYIINMVLINLIHSGFINTWISDQSNTVSTSCKTVDLKIILPSQLLNIEYRP